MLLIKDPSLKYMIINYCIFPYCFENHLSLNHHKITYLSAFYSLIQRRTKILLQSLKLSWFPYHLECRDTLEAPPEATISILIISLIFFSLMLRNIQKNLDT